MATDVISQKSKVVKLPLGKRKMLIGGELVGSVSGRWLESINPADEGKSARGSCPSGMIPWPV